MGIGIIIFCILTFLGEMKRYKAPACCVFFFVLGVANISYTHIDGQYFQMLVNILNKLALKYFPTKIVTQLFDS